MTINDYEWCCIFEQYIEDALISTLDAERLLGSAENQLPFDLGVFLKYYSKFEFLFEGEEMQCPTRWMTDLPGMLQCFLVTITQV